MMTNNNYTKEILLETVNHGVCDEGGSPIPNEERPRVSSTSSHSFLAACRVCQCAESDQRGDAALEFLGINPAFKRSHKMIKDDDTRELGLVEFVSPNGEVFVCNTDVETGFGRNEEMLIELGCSCKSDLGLVHYACALKWFVNHGSTVCEICGSVAKNIKSADLKKVVGSLKEYEMLRERTANGVPNPAQVKISTSSGVDPDAVAAIRRQRLSEISLWFGPQNNSSRIERISIVDEQQQQQQQREQEAVTAENPATKWAVEGTGILLATGLLTVTLAWLIAPRVGKRTAKSGLHILLGGICALTVVVFFRFFVLTRIKYGPARYWAILFIFWFLVFGIWASRTHSAHAT